MNSTANFALRSTAACLQVTNLRAVSVSFPIDPESFVIIAVTNKQTEESKNVTSSAIAELSNNT